jgi:hypothetical protein
VLEHCAANRKRLLSALPDVGPYIYTTLKFLALQGVPYIYDISRLKVKMDSRNRSYRCGLVSGWSVLLDCCNTVMHLELLKMNVMP